MTFQQKASGAMMYPTKGTLNNLLFKIPAVWWRSIHVKKTDTHHPCRPT